MNRVLAVFSDYEFFNTGMQNRYLESGESYRIYVGSNTAASIDETTGKMLSAGYAFCKVKKMVMKAQLVIVVDLNFGVALT